MSKVARWLWLVYRNVILGKEWPKARFFNTGAFNGVEMRIKVSRPWTVGPDQYLYVCAPGVSPFAFVQSHPYCIAWWENGSDGSLETVSLLIQPLRGFSSQVLRATKRATWMPVAIEGPYGSSTDTSAFHLLVLFGSGIGIAALLPIIKQALEVRKPALSPLQRILLVWSVEESGGST